MGELHGANFDSSRNSEFIKKIIKIRTQYEEKMKAKLNEVRQTYSVKYQEFISSIQYNADEIMRLYEEILRERENKDAAYSHGLLELESRRRYADREEKLRKDIDELEVEISGWRGKLARLQGDWEPQLRRLDEELEALKNKLRELMMTMKEDAESKYTVTNEVAIYDKLLSFEESRISHASTVSKKRVTVNSQTSRKSNFVSGSRNPRRESGYDSP